MQFALYSWLKKEGKSVSLDTSYFEDYPRVMNSDWLVHRAWQLGKFGHEIQNQNLGKGKRLRDLDFFQLYGKYYPDIFSDSGFLSELYPIDQNRVERSTTRLGLSIPELETSIVMHIRQGDYVAVSSLLLHEEYYLEALKQIEELTEGDLELLIVVSDEAVSVDRFPRLVSALESDNGKMKVIAGGDALDVHNVMRKSGALICSNSTFSFSAAMLRGGYNCAYPSRFYNGETSALNQIFKLKSGVEILVR